MPIITSNTFGSAKDIPLDDSIPSSVTINPEGLLFKLFLIVLKGYLIQQIVLAKMTWSYQAIVLLSKHKMKQ